MSTKVYERPDPKVRYAHPPTNPILEYLSIEIDDHIMVANLGNGTWVAAEALDEFMSHIGWKPRVALPKTDEQNRWDNYFMRDSVQRIKDIS